MQRTSLFTSRRVLAASVAALAMTAPAALAHDERSAGGDRKAGAISWEVPVPGLALPSFDIEFDGRSVASRDLLPSMVDGGTLIMSASGASTAPFAQVSQHCPSGEAGGSIRVDRVSPGATIDVYYDPGTKTDAAKAYRLGGQRVPEGDKNTSVATSLCQGL